VSTILKALEKLEREKESLRGTGPVPVISAVGSGTGHPTGWYLKPWLWFGLVGLIIVALSGTAWYFYRQSRDRMPRLAERSATTEQQPVQHPAGTFSRSAAPPVPEAARPEPRQSEPKPVSIPDSTHFQESGAYERPSRPEEPSTATAVKTPPTRENSAVQQPIPAVRPAGASNRTHPPRTPEKVATAREAGGKKDTAPAVPPSPPDRASKGKTPADVYANTPLLTDGRLRVHAIAWAPQPAERMAVINSRVLHEGDSVDDFAVMVIRPDDVVVREKGKGVWRVEFGRP